MITSFPRSDRRNTPFRLDGTDIVIDDDLIDHVKERLGIPPSLFRTWVHLKYPPTSLAWMVLALRAIDNIDGGNRSETIEFIDVGLPDFDWQTFTFTDMVLDLSSE